MVSRSLLTRNNCCPITDVRRHFSTRSLCQTDLSNPSLVRPQTSCRHPFFQGCVQVLTDVTRGRPKVYSTIASPASHLRRLPRKTPLLPCHRTTCDLNTNHGSGKWKLPWLSSPLKKKGNPRRRPVNRIPVCVTPREKSMARAPDAVSHLRDDGRGPAVRSRPAQAQRCRHATTWTHAARAQRPACCGLPQP